VIFLSYNFKKVSIVINQRLKGVKFMLEMKLERGDPSEKCPIEAAIDIIGSKWTFLILRDLLIDGTVRFGDLLRSLDGISPKTLSLRLRELEKYSLVTRIVYAEVPPKVEYKLTEKGKELETVFVELKRWGLTIIDTAK
jgi:DNA-binding HxlR family transcriptional regulator